MKSDILLSIRKPGSIALTAGKQNSIFSASHDFPFSDPAFPQQILSATGKKDDRLKRIIALVAKYYEAQGQVGIILHDKNGTQVIANQVAERLYNNSAKTKTINHLWKTGDVVSRENNKSVPIESAPFMLALQTGKPQKGSFNIQLKNGEQRWLFLHSKPLPNKGETGASGVISSIIDITNEQKLSGTPLRKDVIVSFMNETPNPAWVVDETGSLIYATAAFFNYFGLKEKDSLGKKMTDLVPALLHEALYSKHLKVFETGKQLRTIERIKLANGNYFSSYINLFPVKGEGKEKLVAGHAINLGQTAYNTVKRQHDKEKLLLLSHATSDAIWEWDIKAGCMYRNKVLMNLVGYKSTTPTNLAWWLHHIHPDDIEKLKQKVKQATHKCQPYWQESYRFRCADGQYKYIQDRAYITYENGLPVRMIGSLTDISQIKKLEEELNNERIKHQVEMSETALRVQETERTRIGHELHDNVNQILSTARLFVDTIKTGNEKDKLARNKGLEYISLAIEEIRKLSKELAAPQLKEKGLAENIRLLIEDIHFASSVRFRFTYDPDLKFLSPSKKTVLFRIVQEQVKNIMKHSRAKTGSIAFSMEDGNVVLKVADNGKGFEPGQTYQGIGLSNIRERVKMYHGKMEIDSRPGKGCRLTVTMPVL